MFRLNYFNILQSTIVQKIGAIVLPNIGGVIAGVVFNPQNTDWYKNLIKPKWAPPAWVFAPAWTILYSTMGYASFLVWNEGGGFEGAKLPLTLYGAQLAINWAWSPMFFGLESTKLGLVNFTFLIPTAAACTYEFFKVNCTAGGLMVPYLLWLSFASFLNFTIHILNQKIVKAKQ